MHPLGDGLEQFFDPQDANDAHQVISEHTEAHFRPDLFQAPHEKVPVIHPMLDRAKGMFHELLSLFDFLGMLPHPLLHRLDDRFMNPSG